MKVETMELHGYLIVLKQSIKLSRWLTKFENNDNAIAYLNQFKKKFSSVDPNKYKGIDRFPLEAYSEEELANIELGNILEEKVACKKMYEILRTKQQAFLIYKDFSDDANSFELIEDAFTVYDLLENKNNYEIIELKRKKFNSDETFLGFDIGYWGSDHFSIISDTMIAPQWHAPDPEDFNTLFLFAKRLNKNLLFKTEKDAMEFRKYYLKTKWAETDSPHAGEESEFYIIQVNKVNYQNQ
jgi:hypothetical protein